MSMLPIYELLINDNIDDKAEVSAVALVDEPAIQRDFLAFREQFVEPGMNESKDEFIPRCISYVINEGKDSDQAVAICNSIWDDNHLHFQESYSDYPEAAKENAKIALRWAEENGWGDCGTPVGKIRANQLANGEAISRDTIARMAGFERHRQNSDKPLGDGCGRLMWLAWGGDEGIAHCYSEINGKWSVKVVPSPNLDSTLTRPPCELITASTIESPKPLPSWLFRCLDGSTR